VKRILSLSLVGLTSSGCGLIADWVSNATATEIEMEAIEPTSLAGPDIAPLVFAVTLSDTGVRSYTLPAGADTEAFGPLIKTHLQRLDAGKTGNFAITVDSFVYTGDPTRWVIDISSRDGTVYGNDSLNPTPDAIASCVFDVDNTWTGTQLGTQLTSCSVDWVATNGVPS
jgi:hypothetical protein